ncbi:MAG: type I phosphomannose isomerase catalytic subunit [Luteolibacter sp.]
MDPITFHPQYMPRVWGGRKFESAYGRALPEPDVPFGESWEIVDRENEQSRVDGGKYDGLTLHELWTKHREEVFGEGYARFPRFPVLIKLLDSRDDLSIQVHPRAESPETGAEPKTEMWFVADCDPGATLYVGLKHGVSRSDFEKALNSGTVADCVHSIRPQQGDSIFIPSGRLHAIGAGFLIHEIQQNSDTTYRVYDWNRPGLDGNPRELHIAESMANIDFDDFEPSMDVPSPDGLLAECSWFSTRRLHLAANQAVSNPDMDRFSILSIVEGVLEAADGRQFGKGCMLLIPRGGSPLVAVSAADLLQITVPV